MNRDQDSAVSDTQIEMGRQMTDLMNRSWMLMSSIHQGVPEGFEQASNKWTCLLRKANSRIVDCVVATEDMVQSIQDSAPPEGPIWKWLSDTGNRGEVLARLANCELLSKPILDSDQMFNPGESQELSLMMAPSPGQKPPVAIIVLIRAAGQEGSDQELVAHASLAFAADYAEINRR